MNSPVGQEPPYDQGSGRRFLTKEQYLRPFGQEAYDRQIQRLHAPRPCRRIVICNGRRTIARHNDA